MCLQNPRAKTQSRLFLITSGGSKDPNLFQSKNTLSNGAPLSCLPAVQPMLLKLRNSATMSILLKSKAPIGFNASMRPSPELGRFGGLANTQRSYGCLHTTPFPLLLDCTNLTGAAPVVHQFTALALFTTFGNVQ